jgi:hypothetical protein
MKALLPILLLGPTAKGLSPAVTGKGAAGALNARDNAKISACDGQGLTGSINKPSMIFEGEDGRLR